MISTIISMLSNGLSIYVFIEQRKIKEADVFESRWFRLLDNLKSMTFANNDGFESDFVSELCLKIGFAEAQGDISLRDIADLISENHSGRLVRGTTPDGLYGAFQALANLRKGKTPDKRDFLDQSLFAYVNNKHVAHAFYQAIRREDAKTIAFLIDTGLISRFGEPWLNDHIATLRKACLK